MTSDTSGMLLPRRVAILGGAAAAAPLAAPFVARAGDVIRIGLLLAKSGQVAGQTEYLVNGTFLALHERDDTIMGRPAELVWFDEPTPQASMQNMRKLVEEQKVCAVLGGSLASNALAEEAAAALLKVPFVCNNAAATEITGGQCNRYTFRFRTPAAAQCRMLAPVALTYGKTWYLLTASYGFGQDVLRSTRELLQAAGGSEAGADEVPLNTADFSPFIMKIRHAKPDVVIGGLPASELAVFLKQWNGLGMKGAIPFVQVAIGDTDIWAAGPECATGLFTKMWDHANPGNPPYEKAFAAAYLKKYRKPAADAAWMGWMSARSLFESIDRAGSLDPMAIVEGLEAWQTPAGDSFYSYRRFDHQMLARNIAVKVKERITDKWDYFDVKARVPESGANLDSIYGSQDEIGCKME